MDEHAHGRAGFVLGRDGGDLRDRLAGHCRIFAQEMRPEHVASHDDQEEEGSDGPGFLFKRGAQVTVGCQLSKQSSMAQRKRAGLITPRSLDRNELLLLCF